MEVDFEDVIVLLLDDLVVVAAEVDDEEDKDVGSVVAGSFGVVEMTEESVGARVGLLVVFGVTVDEVEEAVVGKIGLIIEDRDDEMGTILVEVLVAFEVIVGEVEIAVVVGKIGLIMDDRDDKMGTTELVELLVVFGDAVDKV